MKYLKSLLIASVIFLMAGQALMAQENKPEKIGLDFGLSYWTDYYYRGQSFYGANTGVFFPWVGYGGLGNFYFYLGGEVAAETLGDWKDPDQRGGGKQWYGIDFIVSYSNTVADDLITLGGRVGYFTYPRSWDNTSSIPLYDFITVRFKIGFNVLLNPTLQYDHNFWLDKGLESGHALDGYITLSIGHSFGLTDAVSLNLGLKGSLWYDYRDAGEGTAGFGFSDMLASVGFSYAGAKGLSFNASMNMGHQFDDDLNYNNDDWKWFAKFGVSYSI
jgi:hypothetical protein